MPLIFQRGRSRGLDATYQFTFTGDSDTIATVVIRDRRLEFQPGHLGEPDTWATADARTWLGFLAGERSLVWALLMRRVRLRGDPRLLIAFGRCFPS